MFLQRDGTGKMGNHTEKSLLNHFRMQWDLALEGVPEARKQWTTVEGGKWSWEKEGLRVSSSGEDWSGYQWVEARSGTLQAMENFMVEVTISGEAEAAGLSFGPFKDFLVKIDLTQGRRRLQVEVDGRAGRWAFRVDGQLVERQWWDSAVQSTKDLLNGTLLLKSQQVENVLFQDLAFCTFNSSTELGVIMTCQRFLQRLRVSLRNWLHQSLDTGAIEIIVVNPHSNDGTHDYLAAVAASYPHVRVRELLVPKEFETNKGAMINHAVSRSQSEWLWLTDADCLFSPNCAEEALKQINGKRNHLFFGQRRFLSSSYTDALLTGRIDGLADFHLLACKTEPRSPENEPWGYTQIMHRSILERVRYPETYNHFAHSDGTFIEKCKRNRIKVEQIPGLFCLHLDHPFAWYGTDRFL
jgi:hypothetical protein